MKAKQLKVGDRFIHPGEPEIVWQIILGFAGRDKEHPRCMVVHLGTTSFREIGTQTFVPSGDEIWLLCKVNPLLDKLLSV
jgi:hypothetical protein